MPKGVWTWFSGVIDRANLAQRKIRIACRNMATVFIFCKDLQQFRKKNSSSVMLLASYFVQKCCKSTTKFKTGCNKQLGREGTLLFPRATDTCVGRSLIRWRRLNLDAFSFWVPGASQLCAGIFYSVYAALCVALIHILKCNCTVYPLS